MTTGLSRRAVLKSLGLTGAAIAAMPELSRVLLFQREVLARDVAQPGGAGQPATLSAAEGATLAAMCARLIPTDEHGPGATEARAAHYIDRALGNFLSGSREAYSQGLAMVDDAARGTRGTRFVDLSAAEQDVVLTGIESTPFFTLVRGHTLQGTFGDPLYGGNANMVGWDLIGYPGVRLNVTAAEQNMSTPAKPNRRSAYDYAMFSAGMGGM
jgi:gluconate 2-dehydrogenase gamma chain